MKRLKGDSFGGLPVTIVYDTYVKEINDAIDSLAQFYEGKEKPESYEQIIADNSSLDFNRLDQISRDCTFGTSFNKYLEDIRLLETDMPSWDDVTEINGKVIVPEGIRYIPERAFEGKSIDEIILPKSLERIEDYAFLRCSGPDALDIPDNVSWIGMCAFERSFIRHIKLPKGIDEIFYRCFNSSWIEEITIPEGVREIGDYAFADCSELEKAVLPESLEKIGWSAFSGCTKLSQVEGKDLENIKISDGAFDLCFKLADENGYIVINRKLFRSSAINKYEKVVIPDGVEELLCGSICPNNDVVCRDEKGKEIRKFCTEVVIPDSVTKISDNAFICTDPIKKVFVPDGLKLPEHVIKALATVKVMMVKDGIVSEYVQPQAEYVTFEYTDVDEIEFEGRIFVLTGFDYIEEPKLKDIIKSRGGEVKNSTVVKTDYLIMNRSDYDHYPSRYVKAREYNEKGKSNIAILKSETFFRLTGIEL